MKKIMQYKLNNLILVVFLALLTIDFFSRIYVKVPAEQRLLDFDMLPQLNRSLPYSADSLTLLASQWERENNDESVEGSSLVKDLSNYDSLEMAGFRVALLSIYSDGDWKALLWFKDTKTGVEQLLRAGQGEELNGFTLESVGQKDLLLKHSGSQLELQLFKPAGKSLAGNKNTNEKN
jgi:hypothetical protein